jgi:hypothetical protein
MKLMQANIESFNLDEMLTRGNIEKLITIQGKSIQWFLTTYKINVDKKENCNNGKGYRNLYRLGNVIDKANALGLIVTKSKHELETMEECNLAKDEISYLKKHIETLQKEIEKKEHTLKILRAHIEICGRKVKQLVDQPLLDEDAILLLAGIRKKRCGIYFLIKNDEIVYVGQSVNIHNRIATHENVKDFDRFTYVECEQRDLSRIEAMYIDMYKPKYNYNSIGRLVMPMSKDEAYSVFLR